MWLIHEQHGNNPKQWNKSVEDVGTHDTYFVTVGGSRQITKRNRQFLQKIQPQKQSFDNSEASSVFLTPSFFMSCFWFGTYLFSKIQTNRFTDFDLFQQVYFKYLNEKKYRISPKTKQCVCTLGGE